ncbi:hypothetical protein L6452_14606 [Arctium lappa]|uniref:Uncharacterized protein n=1 Tax=Arctium lappa TaxID=4217 RepID=A0ACB9CLI4_ARCLA|nr:hypothetical protein L6452_14606 [Arctium lappa]
MTNSPSNMTHSQNLNLDLNLNLSFPAVKGLPEKRRQGSPSMNSEDSVTTTCLDGGFREYSYIHGGREVHLFESVQLMRPTVDFDLQEEGSILCRILDSGDFCRSPA